MRQLETIKNSDSSSLNRSTNDSSSRSARRKHVTAWDKGEASSSKDAGKKAMPREIAQSSQDRQNHHIEINQEQETNEIRPINEEVSPSQRTP